MHTSINAQFKNFEDVLAKQQRTFEEMQASTMAQFKQFYEILGISLSGSKFWPTNFGVQFWPTIY
jgi:hypothetical protein